MKQVTAKDVAKRAGVSQSTVSRVYFEGATVSARSKEKVLKAAEELGYRPNEFARSLITNQTRLIGLVMKGVENPFYPEVLKQFATSFKEHGYNVMFVYTNNDEIQREDVESLLNYNVAATIVTDAAISIAAAEEFRRHDIPLVFFNRKMENPFFYSVTCNNYRAGQQIGEYLLSAGCREIAFIAGSEYTSTSQEREKGFREALERQGIRYQRFSGAYTYESGYAAAKEMLGGERLPDACFAANDIMALGVLDAFQEMGVHVPEQVRVVGFDNIEMAGWPGYGLTTWEQPIDGMVAQTVSYLLEEIEQYSGNAHLIELDGRFIKRKTT